MKAWTQALTALGLNFPNPADERAFRLEFGQSVIAVIRGAFVAGLIVMLMLTLRDVQLSGLYGKAPIIYRLFVFIPLMSTGLALTFAPQVERRQQVFSAVFAALILAATFGFFLIAPSIAGQPLVQNFRAMSIVLLIFGLCGLFGLRLPLAILIAAAAIGVWIADATLNKLPAAQWLPTAIVLASATLLACLVAYWIERLHRQQFAKRLALTTEKLRHEEMFASLPAHAAARFASGQRPIADAYVDVLAGFADLAGFTEVSKRIGPMETVRILDLVFSRFDDVVAKHGLERVKIMGDGYLFVAGTQPDAGGPDEAAHAALEMIQVVADIAAQQGLPLELRIGMHSGPVIGGVVGKQRPAYDYWGDTLVIAEQLEACGKAGRVCCSESVFWRLDKNWSFESHGPVELDGYSLLRTYVLLEAKQAGRLRA